jgi:hypothetical protein
MRVASLSGGAAVQRGLFVEKPGSEKDQRGLSRARMETKTREARVLGSRAYAASVRPGGLRLRDL